MPAESRLIEEVKAFVKSLGGKVVKIHQSGFSELGTPDLLVITPIHGTVWAEAKAPGEVPAPLQAQRIVEIQLAGGQAFWFDSLTMFLDKLRQME